MSASWSLPSLLACAPHSHSLPPAIFLWIHIWLPVGRGHREGLGWETECRVPCHPGSLCAGATAG